MISAFLIVQDEALNLRECLESVAWADEIVVLDSGSTDATRDIARAFTDRVFERPFTDFADQKNHALAQVRGDWAFSIDADERVPSELRDEILAVVRDPAASSAYRVPRKNFFRGRWIRSFYPDYQMRLFRRDGARFVGIVHETLEIEGAVGTLQNPLHHYSAPTVAGYLRKALRYTALEADRRRANGERVRLRSLIGRPSREAYRWLVRRRAWQDGWRGWLLVVVMAFYAGAVAWHGWRGSRTTSVS